MEAKTRATASRFIVKRAQRFASLFWAGVTAKKGE
jgi:hypothetical protein